MNRIWWKRNTSLIKLLSPLALIGRRQYGTRGMYTNIGAWPWHPAGWVIYHNSEGDSGIHAVVILPIR